MEKKENASRESLNGHVNHGINGHDRQQINGDSAGHASRGLRTVSFPSDDRVPGLSDIQESASFRPRPSRFSQYRSEKGRRSAHPDRRSVVITDANPLRAPPTDHDWRAGAAGCVDHAHKPVFADAQSMKKAMHKDIDKQEYDVHDFYKTQGLAQCIARSEWFGGLTLFVIGINAIWIGVETDYNEEEHLNKADIGWQVGEHLFAVFFTGELLIRFAAFQEKRNCFRDTWFKFDSLLVTFMVTETWIMNILFRDQSIKVNLGMLRLLRLLRLTRMARLMRSVPELMTICRGMVAATRSVGTALMLLLIFMYVWAIVFKTQLGEDEDVGVYFSSIPVCMWTLMLQGTLLDNITEVLDNVRQVSPVLTIFFMIFVALAAIMTMNMLIGILCEVIGAVAEAEKEKLVVEFVRERLLAVIEEKDTNGNREISKSEFAELIVDQRAIKALAALGVDSKHLESLADQMFEVGDEDGDVREISLSYAEFMEFLMHLRQTEKVSVAHLMDMRRFIRYKNKGHTEDLLKTQNKQDDLEKELGDVIQSVNEIKTFFGLPLASPEEKKKKSGQKWKNAVKSLQNAKESKDRENQHHTSSTTLASTENGSSKGLSDIPEGTASRESTGSTAQKVEAGKGRAVPSPAKAESPRPNGTSRGRAVVANSKPLKEADSD